MDEKFICLAMELAGKGAGFVSPNPMVGCVIVKNGKIAGKGYHKYFGGTHAEVNAIRSVRSSHLLKNSTMYVNLEPCSHTNKKNPPCVPEIIKAGVKKVVISMKDPNPQVNGRGIRQLKSAGIECNAGILEEAARYLNRFYIKYITKKMPYVISKWAMSLDGKIATRTGDARWISSEKSREYTHKLRGELDALLVGIGTVLKDNPTLTARYGKRWSNKRQPCCAGLLSRNLQERQPMRLLLDPYLKVPLNSNVLNRDASTIIFYDGSLLDKKSRAKLDILCNSNVSTQEFKTKNREFNLSEIMLFLAKTGVSSVLIEGGGNTHASALKYGIVDEIYAFIAPKIIGGRDAITPVEGDGINKISESLNLKEVRFEKVGEDILVKGYF